MMKLNERYLYEQKVMPKNAFIPLDKHTIEFPYMHFDQDIIIRHYYPIRFDKRYRNSSMIAQEDFMTAIDSGLYHIKNYECQYGHKDKPDYYLVIDEKEKDFNQYVLGGIMITPDESKYIINFMNKYKRIIRPSTKPENWFVKGDNKHERRFKKDNFNFTKDYNMERWKIFGEMLEYLRVNYSFHFSIIDEIKKRVDMYSKKSEKTLLRNKSKKEAFINLLSSLDMFKYNNLKIITDDIDKGTEKIYNDAIKEYFSDKDEQYVTLDIVKKKDMYKDEGILLQYVDINLFAIFRFLFPNMHKGAYNILVDFEHFGYYNFQQYKHKKMTKKEINYIERISKQFEFIKNVYHNIRFHTLKNIFIKDKLDGEKVFPISSMIYSNDEIDYNFGLNFGLGVRKFCTVRTNETFSRNEIPIDFNQISIPSQ